MKNAVMAKTYKRRKTNLTIFLIMTALVIACIIGIIISANDTSRADDTEILKFIVAGVLLFVFSMIPFQFYLALRNYINMIGGELKAEMNEEHIMLEDNVEFQTLEKKYAWSDIENAVVQIYNAGLMKSSFCIKFVVNSQSEYNALSKAEKRQLSPFEKRDLMLNSEFYIDCTKDDVNRILKLWGRKYEKEALYYGQIKSR